MTEYSRAAAKEGASRAGDMTLKIKETVMASYITSNMFKRANDINASQAVGEITGDPTSLVRTIVWPIATATVAILTLIITAIVTGTRDADLKDSDTTLVFGVNVVCLILLTFAFFAFLRRVGIKVGSRFRGMRLQI